MKSNGINSVIKQMQKAQFPGHNVMNALNEINFSSAVMQMQRMQTDVSAIIKERETYFPNSLKAVLEMNDAAQQLRNSFAQISQLSAMDEHIKEARRVSATIAERFEEMAQFKIPNLLGDWKLPELPTIDWEAITKKQRKGVVELAKKGWTISPWMPLPDISELGKSTQDEIEKYFVESYLGRAGEKGELEGTARALLESTKLEQWKNLLEEVFFCIENCKYKVCVPPLLTVLEGFIMESLHKEHDVNRNSIKVRDAVEGTKWHEQDNFVGIMWMSVVTFIQQLFADSHFDSMAPSFINRHWVLHGRSSTDWTTADAFRLINALTTVHWYFS